ncbi:MAG: citrate lyase holo-[acyl-carrier protein] synthase [Lachnospiraceae bacterium]
MDNHVSLAQMLAAREHRAAIQSNILSQHRLPLVCFTLNIPGPVKVLPLVPDAFNAGIRQILHALEAQGMAVVCQKEIREITGYEAFLAVDGDGLSIKKLMTGLEDCSQLGRLFDIDVLLPDGQKLSREDIQMPPRTCLLCSENAHVCSRSRAHTVEQLTERITQILEKEFPL